MAPERICRQAGDAKKQVNLPPPDAACGLKDRLHICPACHPPQPETTPDINPLTSSICQPDICMRIQLFPVGNILHMMTIPSTILILIQICWLMMVSTLSVVWWGVKYSFWRQKQRIEQWYYWWRALTERHGILEIIIIYNYVLLKNNIVIKKKVYENTRKAAKTKWMMDCAKMNDCRFWIQPW